MFLQRSEAGKAFQLVRESKRSNVSTVFWATGTLDNQPQSITVPVDSTIKRITFVFSVDTKGGWLKLTQPSGGAVSENSAGTEISELNCGRILTVNAPEAGEWRAEIGGAGKFWLQALGQSDIYFIKSEFVKPGGRPGHEGLFRIQGQPLAGAPATLQVSLSAAPTASSEFYMVSERGQSIQKLPMHAENADREFLEFTGRVVLPDVPFRVAVMGRDVNGKPYQRFFSNLFHAESVEISPKLDTDQMPAGTTQQAAFAIRNIGALRTFSVTVTDARHFVSKVEPKELTLREGESGTVHVELTLPAGTAAGVGDDLVVVAKSSAGPPTSNSSVVHFSVSAPAASQNHH
jgi:hypothetical protein